MKKSLILLALKCITSFAFLSSNGTWLPPVDAVDNLPATSNPGDCRAVKDSGASYCWDGSSWVTGGGGGGSGTVTTVSVVSANGLAGTVTNATTHPAITLSTTITGVLKGNGTAISAQTTGDLSDVGTDGITVGAGSGAVLGSGTTISQHVSDTTHAGYLSSTDWNTFNGKQSGPLTGDVTTSGAAATLATVATPGTTGSSTAIPVVTINAKGLTTGITTAAVVAPAGTLSGTTLASNVVTSSLTAVGTIGTGVWNGTAITVANGGTGLATLTTGNVILGAGTSTPTFVAPSTSGNVLTSNGSTWISSPASGGGPSVPGTTIVGNMVTWNSTTGAAIADLGIPIKVSTPVAGVAGNNYGIGNPTTLPGNNSSASCIAFGNTSNCSVPQSVAMGFRSKCDGGSGECVSIGGYASDSDGGQKSTSVGYAASLNGSGDSSIHLGHYAGAYDTDANVLEINSIDRTNKSGDQTKSIIYGVMNATAASQTLTFNAAVTLGPTSATPQHIINTATATTASCGSLATACIQITINGSTRYIPYF